MPKYIYGVFAVLLLLTLGLGALVWVEFSQLQQATAAANPEPDIWGLKSGQAAGQTGDTGSRAQNSLSNLFIQAQPEYKAPRHFSTAAAASTPPAQSVTANSPQGKISAARKKTPDIPGSKQGFVGPVQQENYACDNNAKTQPIGKASSDQKKNSGVMGSSQTFVRQNKTAKAAGGDLPSAADDPQVDAGERARTFSIFKTQPASNQPSALQKAKSVGDDSSVAVAQSMEPTVQKKKTVINLIPEYEYGTSEELPELGKSLPGRLSTEKVAADILCEQLRIPVMPKLAESPAPTGDAALRNDFRQWEVNLRPSWTRTDYSTGEDKPSSKVDVFTLRADITYKITDLELTGTPWIERDDISGAVDHDSFTRMGLALSPVYRLLKQQNGKPLDLSAGMDVFGTYTVGDYSYVSDMLQFGVGLGVDARRKLFDFIVLGAGAGWQRSNRELKDLPGNMNLFDLSAYAGFQLGKKFSVTPGITFYSAQNDNLPKKSWTDTQIDMAFALSKNSVINGIVGFHSDPLKSYYIKTNVGLKF